MPVTFFQSAFLIALVVPVSLWAKEPAPQGLVAEASTETMMAAISSLESPEDARLMLINNTPGILAIDPALYTVKGDRVETSQVVLQPHEVRHMLMAEVMKNPSDAHNLGGLMLNYQGKRTSLGAELTVLPRNGRGSVNVTFSSPGEYQSLIQNAAWWMPDEGKALVNVFNSSNQPLTVDIATTAGQSSKVNISPFATRTITLSQGNKQSHYLGLTLRMEGVSGAMRAAGFAVSREGFTSTIRMSGTRNSGTLQLSGSNLKLEDSTVRMVLRNVSNEETKAKIRLLSFQGESSPRLQMEQTIAANNGVDVDLSGLITEALKRKGYDRVSVDISYSGTPGDVIGALTSRDNTTNLTSAVPLRDLGAVATSTGSYPVFMDGDYNTTVSLTNIASVPVQFLAFLHYQDDGIYRWPRQILQPGETRYFDIRQIRDSQQTDVTGVPIPKNVGFANFKWSITGDFKDARINGRSETLSLKDGIRATYCGFMCCPARTDGPRSDSNAGVTFVGSSFVLNTTTHVADCYGYSYDQLDNLNLAVSNTAICSAAQPQLGTTVGNGLAFGSTTGSYFRTVDDWGFDGRDCVNYHNESTEYVQITIPTVSISVPKGIVNGTPANASVTVSYPSGYTGSPLSLTLDLVTTTGTGSAVFSSTNSPTMTTNQTGTFSVGVKGTNTSSTADNIQLRARFNGNTLASRNLSTIFVTLAIRSSGAVSLDNRGRNQYINSSGQSYLGAFAPAQIGVELVGTVTPSNFSDGDAFIMRRTLLNAKGYAGITTGSSLTLNITVPQDDTSSRALRDDDPQSDGSAGKVYDLDAPGVLSTANDPNGIYIKRLRANFREWVEYRDVKASNDFDWYSRSSLKKSSSNVESFDSSVALDNRAGAGTTLTSWNLK